MWDLFAAKLRLSYDTEKAGSISFGYDFSYTSGTNYIENVRALNNGRTKNMELKNSLFLAYDFSWKNLSIGTGVRYEYLLSDLKETYIGKRQNQNYHNFLPSVSLSYNTQTLQQSFSYSIHTEDIFNKNNTRASARLNDIIMHSVGKEETRKVGFTVTYRFRTEKKMNNQSAAETEMSRLNMDNQ